MKQIVVLSGKGGTGKTVMTGALASLVENKVMVDCDVDAADLHLLLSPSVVERHEFRSGHKALTDAALCTHCGRCREVCRFQAIHEDFSIDPSGCEGCGLCARVCPSGAIRMEENVCGEWFVSKTRAGTMVHARLGAGEENSGKLVAQVRQKAREIGEKERRDWVIIDGPPGTGCPVMASLSGVSGVLLVTEPTCSGLHDAGRVIDLAAHFKVPVMLVVNKWDINPDVAHQIEMFCGERGAPSAGRIPFDRSVVEAVVEGCTIMERGSEDVRRAAQGIWERVKGNFSERGAL